MRSVARERALVLEGGGITGKGLGGRGRPDAGFVEQCDIEGAIRLAGSSVASTWALNLQHGVPDLLQMLAQPGAPAPSTFDSEHELSAVGELLCPLPRSTWPTPVAGTLNSLSIWPAWSSATA